MKEEEEEVKKVKEEVVVVNDLETSSVCFFSARAFRSSSLSRIIIVKFTSYISMKEILRPPEVNSPKVMKIMTITIMTSHNI